MADDNMSAPVYIAGVGVISAIGNNVAENLAAFERGEAGMGEITLLDTIHSTKIPVAEVTLSNAELAARSGMPADLSRTNCAAQISRHTGYGCQFSIAELYFGHRNFCTVDRIEQSYFTHARFPALKCGQVFGHIIPYRRNYTDARNIHR